MDKKKPLPKKIVDKNKIGTQSLTLEDIAMFPAHIQEQILKEAKDNNVEIQSRGKNRVNKKTLTAKEIADLSPEAQQKINESKEPETNNTVAPNTLVEQPKPKRNKNQEYITKMYHQHALALQLERKRKAEESAASNNIDISNIAQKSNLVAEDQILAVDSSSGEITSVDTQSLENDIQNNITKSPGFRASFFSYGQKMFGNIFPTLSKVVDYIQEIKKVNTREKNKEYNKLERYAEQSYVMGDFIQTLSREQTKTVGLLKDLLKVIKEKNGGKSLFLGNGIGNNVGTTGGVSRGVVKGAKYLLGSVAFGLGSLLIPKTKEETSNRPTQPNNNKEEQLPLPPPKPEEQLPLPPPKPPEPSKPKPIAKPTVTPQLKKVNVQPSPNNPRTEKSNSDITIDKKSVPSTITEPVLKKDKIVPNKPVVGDLKEPIVTRLSNVLNVINEKVITKKSSISETNMEKKDFLPNSDVDNNEFLSRVLEIKSDVITFKADNIRFNTSSMQQINNGNKESVSPGAGINIGYRTPMPQGMGTSTGGLQSPVSSNFSITSDFGPRHGREHRGIDYAMPIGTPISASHSGTVTRADFSDTYGNVVYLRGDDGTETRYAHLSTIGVQNGQRIERGQPIGLSGNSGRSTGPHLHFEVLRNGQQIDPKQVIGGASAINNVDKKQAPESPEPNAIKSSNTTGAKLNRANPTTGNEIITASANNDFAIRVPNRPQNVNINNNDDISQMNISGGLGTPNEIINPNEPGNVEPYDARDRYNRLFGIAA